MSPEEARLVERATARPNSFSAKGFEIGRISLYGKGHLQVSCRDRFPNERRKWALPSDDTLSQSTGRLPKFFDKIYGGLSCRYDNGPTM